MAPRILFFALANDVGVERLPAEMTKCGAVCALASPPGFYATKTRFLERCFPLRRHYGIWLGMPSARSRLEEAVRVWSPDLLVPLDNVAALLLRNLIEDVTLSPALRDLIVVSFGAPSGYAAACSRAKLMEAAAALPIRLPRHHLAVDETRALEEAASWGYPVVLKAEHTCGGRGVVIARNEDELRSAFAAGSGPAALWRRWRAAGRQRVWESAGIAATEPLPPVMQATIGGVPAMRTVAAWNGEVLEGANFVAECVHPSPTGASTIVRYVDNAEMEMAAQLLVRALGCSGFVSFDFILDPHCGIAHLIEMNPRPIGTTHLGRLFSHDIVAALLARLRGDPVPRVPATPRSNRAVALFPKELERDPTSPERFETGTILHDVPDDDPAVVSAYLRRLSRIHPQAKEAIERAVARDRDALCRSRATGPRFPAIAARG